MKKHMGWIVLAAVVFCAVSVGSWFCGGNLFLPTAAAETGSGEQLSSDSGTVTITAAEYERLMKLEELSEILYYAENLYYKDVDTTALIESAAQGMLSALGDPYSFYYTPEAYAEMWEDDSGEYAGIGVQISINYTTKICTVSRVFKGSPSEEADVHRGDILYRVGEDMLVTSDNINEAIDIMRGTPGTSVDVTFLRNGEEITKTLTRAKIQTNRVDSCMIGDNVGYIVLYEFASNSAADMKEALEELLAKGATGIILDLRDNPGGWLSEANSIADLFVDEGILCYLEDKYGYREYYYTTDGKKDVELVVMTNGNSASSSEILAGCLKDRTNATIVGTQTYGKGIVQNVMGVGDRGAGMQITIAQYFTPNGNAVHGIGIAPDVIAQLPEEDNGMYELGDTSDPQLAIALQVMMEKLSGAIAAEADTVDMTVIAGSMK